MIRCVIFDLDGNYQKVVYKPESSLFSASSLYKPCAIAVDEYGRLFIVSSTTYQGVIVMSESGDFYGFIGAIRRNQDFFKHVYPSCFILPSLYLPSPSVPDISHNAVPSC